MYANNLVIKSRSEIKKVKGSNNDFAIIIFKLFEFPNSKAAL